MTSGVTKRHGLNLEQLARPPGHGVCIHVVAVPRLAGAAMAEDNGLSRSPVVEINTRCPLVPKLTISRSFLPLSGHRTTVAQPAAPVVRWPLSGRKDRDMVSF